MAPLNGHGGLASGVVKLEFHGKELEVSALGHFDWRFHGREGGFWWLALSDCATTRLFVTENSFSEAVSYVGRRILETEVSAHGICMFLGIGRLSMVVNVAVHA